MKRDRRGGYFLPEFTVVTLASFDLFLRFAGCSLWLMQIRKPT